MVVLLLEHRRPRRSSMCLLVCCICRSSRPTVAPRAKSEVAEAARVLPPWGQRQCHGRAKVSGAVLLQGYRCPKRYIPRRPV